MPIYSGGKSLRITIIGAGVVGFHVAEVLCQDNDVVVVDLDHVACERARELDVQVIQGNGASYKVLTEAGVDRSDLVVATTGFDEVNIIACIMATSPRRRTIARVSNPEYIMHPVERGSKFGIDLLICPELVMANEVARILLIPGALDVERFADGKVDMVEYKVDEGSPIAWIPLSASRFPDCIVTAVLRNGETIIPRGDTMIKPGDRVFLIGKHEPIRDLRTLFGETTQRLRNVMIIGGGMVGFYLAGILERENMNVRLIENDSKRCQEIAHLLRSTIILNGDGTDKALLEQENVASMDAVVCVTDSDEKNLLCGLLSKRLGAATTIVRVDRTDYVDLFETVGVDRAISPRIATMNEVVRFTRRSNVEYLAKVEGEMAEVVEVVAREGSEITGKTLSELSFPDGCIIGAVVRGREVFVPHGDDEIKPGDRMIIFALTSRMPDVEKLL